MAVIRANGGLRYVSAVAGDSPKPEAAALIEALHAAMKRHGVSAGGWAVKAGLSRNALYHVFKGRVTGLNMTTLQKLADAIGESPGTFMAFATDEPRPSGTINEEALERAIATAMAEAVKGDLRGSQVPGFLARAARIEVELQLRPPPNPRARANRAKPAQRKVGPKPRPTTRG